MKRKIGLGGLMILVAFAAVAFKVHRILAMRGSVVYVQGDVRSPGKLPAGEGMTVSAALRAAGNPISTGSQIRLVRPSPPGGCCDRTFPIDFPALARGDLKTDYAILPGDRLVVYRDPDPRGPGEATNPRGTLKGPSPKR